MLEVPAGGIDVGETPETTARRELLEETGFTADIIEPLASFYSSPGFCTERGYAFLAMELTPGEAQPEFDETIQVIPVPLNDVPNVIRRGEIQDAKSIASLLLTLNRLGASASV